MVRYWLRAATSVEMTATAISVRRRHVDEIDIEEGERDDGREGRGHIGREPRRGSLEARGTRAMTPTAASIAPTTPSSYQTVKASARGVCGGRIPSRTPRLTVAKPWPVMSLSLWWVKMSAATESDG